MLANSNPSNFARTIYSLNNVILSIYLGYRIPERRVTLKGDTE